jgi:hypothetical protein
MEQGFSQESTQSKREKLRKNNSRNSQLRRGINLLLSISKDRSPRRSLNQEEV